VLDGHWWATAAVALFAFAAASPYTLVDLGRHRNEMEVGMEAMTGGPTYFYFDGQGNLLNVPGFP